MYNFQTRLVGGNENERSKKLGLLASRFIARASTGEIRMMIDAPAGYYSLSFRYTCAVLVSFFFFFFFPYVAFSPPEIISFAVVVTGT